MSITSKKSAYVGISGGVDSSVAAARLKDEGYRVRGVFIEAWRPPLLDCPLEQDRHDAMRVAAHLGIDFTTLNLANAYKRAVIDYLIREYRAGRTPNPDVMCNKHIKFGAFYDWAREEGADIVATGHYAQIMSHASHDSTRVLTRSIDENKDQTYFLWNLTQNHLPHIRFPIGATCKAEVRSEAAQRGLPTATKKDSQGLCFLGKLDMKEFLTHFIETQPGPVLNLCGDIIGEHPGALFFTLGERRGFTITDKTPHDTPRYVVAKDMARNTITVADRRDDDEYTRSSELHITHPHWIGDAPRVGARYAARLRHRQPLFSLMCIELTNSSARFVLDAPQPPAAAGQSLVLYDGIRCLGGGILERGPKSYTRATPFPDSASRYTA